MGDGRDIGRGRNQIAPDDTVGDRDPVGRSRDASGCDGSDIRYRFEAPPISETCWWCGRNGFDAGQASAPRWAISAAERRWPPSIINWTAKAAASPARLPS